MSWRFVACAALFVTCLLTANTIAAKLIVVGGVVLTAGIVIFPISYIVGDVLTEVWGYGAACGRCDACVLRRKGFERAGVADPTRYRAG